MLRGVVAFVVLVILILAYCCELALGTATKETHEMFWGVIALSVVLTVLATVWNALKKRDR